MKKIIIIIMILVILPVMAIAKPKFPAAFAVKDLGNGWYEVDYKTAHFLYYETVGKKVVIPMDKSE